MKYNKITYLVMSAIFLPALSYSTTYNSIVHKHSYEVKDATLIPGKEVGIQVNATNTTSGSSDSGDVTTSFVSLISENGDGIRITTDVQDKESDGRVLTGEWVSSQSLNYSVNDKNETVFSTPNYDGVFYVNLELKDGTYTKVYQSLKLNNTYWTTTDPIYGEWQVDTVVQDWTPDLSTVYEVDEVTQVKITNESRTQQNQEIRTSTGETRNVGNEISDTRDGVEETRTAYGTMEYWEEMEPLVIVDWAVTEIFQDWTPDASNVYETETVSQYREVKKERTIQDQEVRPKTGDIRTVGSAYQDTSLSNEYRDVQGELEYWENIGTPTCTEWALDRYDPWLPDASGYERHEEVEQTRIKYESRECTGQQYRPATGEYRNAESEIEYRSEEEQKTVYGTKIDLNDWFTNDANGDWSVSNDGSYAYQSINGNSTIFESLADTYGNTVISGKMRVRDGAGDDDFIGIVVGKTDGDNFILWSWKKANQSINGGTSKGGHALAKVTGGVAAVNWFMDVSSTGYTVLDSAISTSNGWNHGIYYDFDITYTSTNIVIKLDGTTILSATGSFDIGKIGFFNLSQGQVEYYKVTDNPLD